MKATSGIHHISAIVGNPKENLAFYSSVLGLRLIKKTINFDDPSTYHLYFGNEAGEPGTIMTFFPWSRAFKGTVGTGQVGRTMFAVNHGALNFWTERLKTHQIRTESTKIFDEEALFFEDPHGLPLGIVERTRLVKQPWATKDIPLEKSIRGFAGASLLSSDSVKTAELLEHLLGFEKSAETSNYIRFKTKGEDPHTLDLKKIEERTGSFGVGTVHHIAFRAEDDANQVDWQDYLMKNGYPTTEVKDRQYFKAIYFKEYGEIIMEIATDTPGFTVDEQLDHLGENLQLPDWLESKRTHLEMHLPHLDFK